MLNVPRFGRLVGVAVVLASAARSAAADLPGFRLDDTRWTYNVGELSFDGILIRPEGKGPFPAVLISHGLGGSAESFGLQKAREMVGWGYVCIAPNYTHSRNAIPAPGTRPGRGNNYGASEENLRRAATCLDILASLPDVDKDRIAAYGHSMGGFVTIGLAAREPQRLFAAAISGSGTAPRAGFAAPSAEAAAKIRTPFIMFHGADDTTVRPDQSAALSAALEKNGVARERHVYEGVNHPVDQVKAKEMYSLTKAWFSKHDPR
jgi:dienelactone hydrolase